ncbi:MAG: flippase [Bacteroidota bacterium]
MLRFAAFFLLIRGLSKTDFGIWSIFLVITTFVEEGQVGLLRKPLIRYLNLSERLDLDRSIQTTSLVLNFLLAICLALLVGGYAWLHPYLWDLPSLQGMLQWYLLSLFMLIPFHQFIFLQQAHLQFKGTFWSGLTRQSVFFGYVLFIWFAQQGHYQLEQLVIWQAIACGAGAVIAIATGWQYLHLSWRPDWRWFWKLLHFGKFVAGTRVGTMVLKTMDQLMLGVLVSPVAVASYSTTVRINNLAEVPTQSMADIVFPQSTRQWKKAGKESLKRTYEKSVGVILAMVIPVLLFIFLFPSWVLQIIAGDAYQDAVSILQLVVLYGLFVPFSRQFGTVMDVLGKAKVSFYIMLGSMVLNFCVNLFFIQAWGVIGAVYGTLLCFIVVFLLQQWLLYRELDTTPDKIMSYLGKVYRNGFRLLWTKLKVVNR